MPITVIIGRASSGTPSSSVVYLVREEDGTSKFMLEEGTYFIRLEESVGPEVTVSTEGLTPVVTASLTLSPYENPVVNTDSYYGEGYYGEGAYGFGETTSTSTLLSLILTPVVVTAE